jgi:hypothetical protein
VLSQASSEVTNLAEMIQTLVAGGASIEGAVKQLGKAGVPAPLLGDAQLLYEQRVGRIRELRDPGALVEEKDKGYWYGGEGANDLFWPALRSRLAEDLDGDAIKTISNASDRIVGLLRPPGAPEIRTRGLVLGYVQSGKTTSFMSVIAKGADVGYRLFIVMSGITDNLRSQTQARLEEALVGDLHAKWHLLTSLDSDFNLSGNAANLLANPEQRLLAVVKKNPYRLRRLMTWLDSAGELALRNCPILLIDDEADQASIDVGKKGRTSKINGRILQILSKPKAGYVAYTATPFANMLIDPKYPEGLYPRDFIVDLPRSPDYFGPERIFGREALTPEEEDSAVTDGLDIIRHVLDSHLPDVQPPRGKGAVYGWTPVLTDSLREAVSWFVLATAARRARGVGNKHSSMLVHTSMLAEAHFRLAVPIKQLIDDWRGHLASSADPLWHQLEAHWEAEADRVPPEEGLTRLAWSDVQPHIRDVADETRIVIDNFRATDRLNYPRDEAVTAIVIGGNTLSRGLTLEGLVCSYFARGASAYDTLLQMGRWFGYRRGYADLVRIWMTGALESWFFDLATIEQEIRNEIKRYEEGAELVTPAQLPVRIRTHPLMRITAANKMGGAVALRISYGNTRQQTILFHHKDKGWLQNNLSATQRLLATVAASAVAGGNRDGRPFFKDVSSADVLTFLADYQMHESATAVKAASLADYIEQQNSHGFLTRWNIVVMQHPDSVNGTVDLGLPGQVNLIQRAKMDIPGIPHANVKAIVSTIDRVADLDQPVGEIRRMAAGTADKDLLAVREDLLGDVGLLCLYPISKNSQPKPVTKPDGVRRRVKLEAEEHVIGAALFFPSPKGPQSAVSYMAVPAIEPEPEELEEIEADIDAMDAADEEHGEAEGTTDAAT